MIDNATQLGRFGALMKQRRHELGMSLDDVAHRVFRSRQALSFIECGTMRPSEPLVIALCEVLDLYPDAHEEALALCGLVPSDVLHLILADPKRLCGLVRRAAARKEQP